MKLISLLTCLFSFNILASELPVDLKLENMNGQNVSLENKKQLVYFWATWCKSCLPKLQKTLPEMNKDKMPVVTINMDEQIKRAKRYSSKKGIELPIYRDHGGVLEKGLAIKSLPHWAVIEKTDKGWNLVSQEVGFNKEKIINAFHSKKEN